MYLTILKDSVGSNQWKAENIVDSQKLIVSTALDRFTPFQYVLVPLSCRTRSHALCQIIKKPDMHENFCYLNANVVCVREQSVEKDNVMEYDSKNGETYTEDPTKNESEQVEKTSFKKIESKPNNNLRNPSRKCAQETTEKSSQNISWNENVEHFITDISDTAQKTCDVETETVTVRCELSRKGIEQPPAEEGALKNNERISKEKMTDRGETSKHSDEEVSDRGETGKLSDEKVPYRGETSKHSDEKVSDRGEIGKFLDEEIPDRGEISNHPDKILNVFEEFTGNKVDLSSIVELADEVEHCKRVDVSVVVKRGFEGTNEEFNRIVKQILTMYTFTSRSYIHVNLDNIHSIVIHHATASPNKPAKSAPGKTDPLTEVTTPLDTKTSPPHDLSIDSSCTQSTQPKQSTLVNAKFSPPQNPRLLFVSPKTKLTIRATHSVEYYKQRIQFKKQCGCVEEYARYNDTWRCMKQLIECRKRGMGGVDEKRLNSASKILLTGLSGSGKSFLVGTLARALSVPLVTVTGNEFSSPSPGSAEESLADKFRQARHLAEENRGLCILLFEQIHELVPTSSSLSHIMRLSLSLTRHLDAEPADSPLFFIFTSTAAHSIGSQLKPHAHLYLTAPHVDMRQSILEHELGSILSENSKPRERVSLIATECGATADWPLKERSRYAPISIDVSSRESKNSSEIDSVGLISKKSISEKSIRDALIEKVLDVTGSYLPVDLVRVVRVVMMYLTQNPEFTSNGLIFHVLNFIAHYRPSCLKAGSLGVIDLPSNLSHPSRGETGVEKMMGTCEADQGNSVPSRPKSTLTAAEVSEEEWVPELGGLTEVRAQLEKKVEWPFKHAAAFERLGIPRPKGILLYGPPGCAKTSLVRQLALRSSCRVLAVSAAQLYSPYVGEAEANVAQVFHRARSAAPSILFIDEIDSLVGNRNEASTKDVQQSVLSVFLNEMDGVGVKPDLGLKNSSLGHGVLVIAATNRPTALDSALLRPGRLDTLIYVRPPHEKERREILGLVSACGRMSRDVNLDLLAAQTELYSGADLTHLYREAALISLLDKGFDNAEITQDHWLQALGVTRPSLTRNQLKYYEEFEQSM